MLVMNLYVINCVTHFPLNIKINTNDSGEKTTVKKTSTHSGMDIQHFSQVTLHFFQ